MAEWSQAYPISAAIELVSSIGTSDRVWVRGEGFEVTGRPIPESMNVTQGDVESYAQFRLTPPYDDEPITEEAERHTVRVDIFENANRPDVTRIIAEICPADDPQSTTIEEFTVESFEVVEELHRPDLLVNEDFDPGEIEDETRAKRLAKVDEMVRQDKPYYAVLQEIGGSQVEEVLMEEAFESLLQEGYIGETVDGKYELTQEGERMHQAFSDYIYGDPA